MRPQVHTRWKKGKTVRIYRGCYLGQQFGIPADCWEDALEIAARRFGVNKSELRRRFHDENCEDSMVQSDRNEVMTIIY